MIPPLLATVLRVVGTLLVAAAVLLLLFGWFAEAMSEYPRQHQEASQYLVGGMVLVLVGIVCLMKGRPPTQ